MNQRDLNSTAVTIITILIIYTFNDVFFFNFKAYNLLNIALLSVVMLQIVKFHVNPVNGSTICNYCILLFIFLAGINIKFKIKVYSFLLALFITYLIQYYYAVRHTETPWKQVSLENVILLPSSLIVAISFILIITGTGKPAILVTLALALATLQIYDARRTMKNKYGTGGKE